MSLKRSYVLLSSFCVCCPSKYILILSFALLRCSINCWKGAEEHCIPGISMGDRKVLQATNVWNWNFAFQWRHHYSAEVPVIGEELGNRNHAEDRDQVDTVGQKHQWVSNPEMPARGHQGWGNEGGVTEINSRRENRGLLWKVSEIPPGLSVSISASPLPAAACIWINNGFSCTSGNMTWVWKFQYKSR